MRHVAKNQQDDERCTFCIPNQGWKNRVVIHRRTENTEIQWFAKKLASQTSQIASDFKSHDFKSRDADFNSLAMQDS